MLFTMHDMLSTMTMQAQRVQALYVAFMATYVPHMHSMHGSHCMRIAHRETHGNVHTAYSPSLARCACQPSGLSRTLQVVLLSSTTSMHGAESFCN